MLKFLPLGAAIATIVSTQIPIHIPVATQEQIQANRSVVLADAFNLNSPEDNNNDIGKILTVAVVGGTAAGVILSTRKSGKTSSYSTTQIDLASPKLRKQLLTLLHNDRAAADRLVTQVKRNHPDRSINWAAEKAIYDLERDRGGR